MKGKCNMSIYSLLEAMTLKAGHLLNKDNVRFTGWTTASSTLYFRLYYQYGNFLSYDYILADPLIQHLSVEQILSDGIVFKYEDNFLTIEEIGNAAFNKI